MAFSINEPSERCTAVEQPTSITYVIQNYRPYSVEPVQDAFLGGKHELRPR
jgi:hypothetical protein